MVWLIWTILILLIIDLYVYRTFRHIELERYGRSHWITWTFWGISLAFFSSMLFLDHPPKLAPEWQWVLWLRALIMILYFSRWLIILTQIIQDLTLFYRKCRAWLFPKHTYNPSRNKFLTQSGILLASVPAMAFTYGMVRNPYRYKLHSVRVPIQGLPADLNGFKIVQISDIHAGSFFFKEPLENAIRMVNDQKPDVIAFTGDLVNVYANEIDPYIDLFSRLKSKYGVYSVLGNHDYGDYSNWNHPKDKELNFQALIERHQQLGWKLMRNSSSTINVNQSSIALIGVENTSPHHGWPSHGDLATAYQGTESSDVRILMSHDPSHWNMEVTTKYKDIQLTLSGHTHGFQFGVEIPGWFQWSPAKYIYPQWAGLYTEGNQHIYVNRGLGFLGYPGRLGILPEVTSIELVSTSDV